MEIHHRGKSLINGNPYARGNSPGRRRALIMMIVIIIIIIIIIMIMVIIIM